MSLSLSKSLAAHLDQIILGPPQYERRGKLDNMIVYSLFPSSLSPDPTDIITLSEALNRGLTLQDTGVISRIHIDNPLPAAVLAGESELLMGETQQRSVQFSCLIPPQRKASLPVNCVEEGRPTIAQTTFTGADACPWPVRSFKIEQLAHSGEPQQYWVWDQVKTYLTEAGADTQTHDIHAVLEQHSYKLQALSGAFPRQAAQVGAICAVGQNLYLELFGDPELFDDRYDQILRSAMVEALVRPSDQCLPQEAVPAFMEQLVQASLHSRMMSSRSLKDSGRALAFSHMDINGQVLIADNKLVHLVAHQKCMGRSQSLAALRSGLDDAQQTWNSRRPIFLDDVEATYHRRRQRYNTFKSRLREAPHTATKSTPSSAADTDEVLDAAAPPHPLSPALRDFFLHLFSGDR